MQYQLSKKEYIELLSLVSLYDFCLEKTVTFYYDLLGYFSELLTVIPKQNCSTFKKYLLFKGRTVLSFGLKIRN